MNHQLQSCLVISFINLILRGIISRFGLVFMLCIVRIVNPRGFWLFLGISRLTRWIIFGYNRSFCSLLMISNWALASFYYQHTISQVIFWYHSGLLQIVILVTWTNPRLLGSLFWLFRTYTQSSSVLFMGSPIQFQLYYF